MKHKILLSIVLMLCFSWTIAQNTTEDRILRIENRLDSLSKTSKGLSQNADFSLSGGSVQEFLRGLAEAHELNINVDPELNFKIYNNFSGEKVATVILFLCKEYQLDIRFTGSIMSFYKYIPPIEVAVYTPRIIEVQYIPYSDHLTLDLRNDTLNQVVKKIIQLSKKNVILSPEVIDKKVSIYVENMIFENALEKMAFANNLKVIKTEDQSYLIKLLPEGDDGFLSMQTKDKKKAARARNNIGGNSSMSSQQNEGSGGFMDLEVVVDSLNKKTLTIDAVNASIQNLIKEGAKEMGVSYFIYADIKGTTTTNVSNLNFDEFLTYVLQGSEYTYKVDGNIYLIGDRKSEGLRANKVYQFQYRSLDAINEIIPAEIKKGVEIKEFKELNSILLTGSLPQINEIISFIKPLDRLIPMITIEVIILDVNKGHKVETGLRAGLSDTMKTEGSIFPALNMTLSSRSINSFLDLFKIGGQQAINIGKVSPNFFIGLSALENNQNVEVRNMPKLSTLNGHEANLSIGRTRYYKLTTANVLGSLSPTTVTTEQYQSVEANLAINIKPVVSGDDQVTLTIDVNISDFLGEAMAGPPPTSKSQFKSILRVRNEDMLVLGGIERYEKSRTGRGVPILSRIPILKWFFSSKTASKNKTVSIVFIKPTIIYQ